jgi:hypothetical protein
LRRLNVIHEKAGARLSKSRTTRRQFHRQVAALAVAPVLAAGAAAQGAPPRPTVGQSLAEVVRLRHGRHLSDEQMQHVRAAIAANLGLADRLGRVALQNGDEPAFAFGADVP